MSQLEALEGSRALSRCLIPLLDAMQWEGDRRALVEARPYYLNEIDELGILNTMANLGFVTASKNSFLHLHDARVVPCIFIAKSGTPYVIKEVHDTHLFVFNGSTGAFEEIPRTMQWGTFLYFSQPQEGEVDQAGPHDAQAGWVENVMKRFLPLGILLAVVSCCSVLVALCVPFLIIALLQSIESVKPHQQLVLITSGMILLIAADFMYRLMRESMQTYIAARVEFITKSEIFRRLVFLSPSKTERLPLATLVAKVKEGVSVGGFLESVTIEALLEFPFLVLLGVALYLLGGEIVFVPLLAAGVMVVVALSVRPWISHLLCHREKYREEKQAYLLDMVQSFRAIKAVGIHSYWRTRYSRVVANVAYAGYRASLFESIIQSVLTTIVAIAVLFSLSMAVTKVVIGDLPNMAIIGVVMIVWRLLLPLKNALSHPSEWWHFRKSVTQCNTLMAEELERTKPRGIHLHQHLEGALSFQEVTLRYEDSSFPVIERVSFEIAPGKLVILTGHDGSGKSAILKLLLGMYKPQEGHVAIDSYNVQQLEPFFLRHSIAYSPRRVDVFYGTLRQNLLLGNPLATDAEIKAACSAIGFKDTLDLLPNGLETKIDHIWHSASMMRQLSLVRALLQPGKILLLDSPDHGLESSQVDKLCALLATFRGKRTVVVITREPKIKSLADQMLLLDKGHVASHFNLAHV